MRLMKTKAEILEERKKLQTAYAHRRSYGGPDPDPGGTQAVLAAYDALAWVLGRADAPSGREIRKDL